MTNDSLQAISSLSLCSNFHFWRFPCNWFYIRNFCRLFFFNSMISNVFIQKQHGSSQPLPKGTVRKSHIPSPIGIIGHEDMSSHLLQSIYMTSKFGQFQNGLWRLFIRSTARLIFVDLNRSFGPRTPLALPLDCAISASPPLEDRYCNQKMFN